MMSPLDYAISNLSHWRRFYGAAYRFGRNIGIDGVDNMNIQEQKNFG